MALAKLCFEILDCVSLAEAQQLAKNEMARLGSAKPIAIVRPYSPMEDRRIAYETEIGEDGLTRQQRRAQEAEEIERQLDDI